MNAMILAAGLGTRLKPLTDTMPKALVPIEGKPLLQIQIERLKQQGFCHIVVNIHHFGQQIIDFLAEHDNFGLDIRISDERQELLDTGGALKRACPMFSGSHPVLVHNVDILHNIDLQPIYQQAVDTDADALLLVSQRETSRYLLFDEENRLVGWTNVKTGEVKSPFETVRNAPTSCRALAFSGIHLFSPALHELMLDWPDRFSVIDFYLQACATRAIRAVTLTEPLVDVGKMPILKSL